MQCWDLWWSTFSSSFWRCWQDWNFCWVLKDLATDDQVWMDFFGEMFFWFNIGDDQHQWSNLKDLSTNIKVFIDFVRCFCQNNLATISISIIGPIKMMCVTGLLKWGRNLEESSKLKCTQDAKFTGPMHNVYIVQFFSFRPSAVGHIVQPRDCHIIEHIFVPAHSVERNNEKIRFPWASNSKFVIFPQIFPCSKYKICPIIPR